MNEVIQTILNHRSLRQFEDKQLTDEQIKTIVTCAQSASTSSFIQAYSIIGVKDKEKKKKFWQNGRFLHLIIESVRKIFAIAMQNCAVQPND